MADVRSPAKADDADYEAIEAAVMETARGRWFLAEFARRTRAADTRALLDAVARLEELVRRQRLPSAPPNSDRSDAPSAPAAARAEPDWPVPAPSDDAREVAGPSPEADAPSPERGGADADLPPPATQPASPGPDGIWDDAAAAEARAVLASVDAFADIERLGTREKLSRFT